MAQLLPFIRNFGYASVGFCISKAHTAFYSEYWIMQEYEKQLPRYEAEQLELRAILRERTWTDKEELRHGQLVRWQFLPEREAIRVRPEILASAM